ncbi:hypothetical protein GCM10027610_134780 [Dactylosporangium cerinum]
MVDRGDRLDQGVRGGLAALAVHQLGELLKAVGEHAAEREEPLAPAGEAESGPPTRRVPGPGDRVGDMIGEATGKRPTSSPLAGLVEISEPSSMAGTPGVRVAVMARV